MADIGTTVAFSSLAGTTESRWLRLVQVGVEDQTATMDAAAELIDALYGTSPCETGGSQSSDGGELPPPEPPEEEEFLSLAADSLGDLCAEQNHWDVQVDVLRSHQTPAAWQLRSETARRLRTSIVVETRIETVSLAGADHYDLEYPYHGGLSVRGAEVADVRGSTVNFARPAYGRVRLTYTTRYERLTLRVPATPGAHGQAEAEPAAVIVFWDRRAAQLDLRQPEPDDSIDAAELSRLCNRRYSVKDEDKDCWQTIRHLVRCRCSDREADSWEEEVAVSCPEGTTPGRHLGTVERFAGYTWCEGETDEQLSDPEYYKSVCCVYPPKPLPHCRRTYAEYRGGAEIEGGAASWRERYGDNVVLTPISPPGGLCGRLITEWEVERQNCCDDIVPLSPHPDNPTEFYAGESHWICVRDGRSGPLKWRLSGGLIFHGGGTYKANGSHCELITTQDSVCPQPRITVDDGCQPVTMTFTGGGADEPRLDTHDMAIGSGVRFGLQVRGGVPPYMWQASGAIEIVSTSADGGSAVFRTPEDRYSWCVETITVVDQCGQQDDCTIRNADTGRWLAVPSSEINPCVVPGGSDEVDGSPFTINNGQRTLLPRGGYRVIVNQTGGTMQGSSQPECGRGHLLAADDSAHKNWCNAQNNPSIRMVATYSRGICDMHQGSSSYNYGRWWHQAVLSATRWVCS